MAKELVSSNATKRVYRDGDKAIKEFCKGFPKAEVLNEALISARVEEIGGINLPATLAVSVDENGCWMDRGCMSGERRVSYGKRISIQ